MGKKSIMTVLVLLFFLMTAAVVLAQTETETTEPAVTEEETEAEAPAPRALLILITRSISRCPFSGPVLLSGLGPAAPALVWARPSAGRWKAPPETRIPTEGC